MKVNITNKQQNFYFILIRFSFIKKQINKISVETFFGYFYIFINAEMCEQERGVTSYNALNEIYFVITNPNPKDFIVLCL